MNQLSPKEREVALARLAGKVPVNTQAPADRPQITPPACRDGTCGCGFPGVLLTDLIELPVI